MNSTQLNVDSSEVDKFDQLSAQWWSLEGPFKPLHQINPIRLEFIKSQVELENTKLLDVGCGGGILTEALAREGAHCTGIDLSESALGIARDHAKHTQLTIEYSLTTVEEYANTHAGQFDVVTCMELLEHVPTPESVVAACASLLKPGGFALFSTINRTVQSFLMAIVGAEYILGIIPKGTHEYKKFIQPAELAQWARNHKLDVKTMAGMSYNPLKKEFRLTHSTAVNYLIAARRI